MKLNKSIIIAFIAIISYACGEGNSKEKTAYNAEGVAINQNDRKEIENPVSAEDIKKELQDGSSKAGNTNLLQTGEVKGFYESRNYEPIWKKADFRGDFLEALRNVVNDGLDYEEYHGKRIDELLESSSLNKAEGAELDILLTDAYFSVGDDLVNGKLNPEDFHSSWGVKKDNVDLSRVLKDAIKKGDAGKSIVELKPENGVYNGLRKSLQEYRTRNRDITKIPEGGLIKPGDENERIPQIVRRFKELDLLADNYSTEGNTYSEELQDAVKKHQESQGLQVDGVIGPSTIDYLNKDNEDRLKQLKVNLERWRWYPRDLGEHFVLVNIADYNVSVVKNGDTISSRKAIVGKQGWETPLFSDTLSYVVLNPTWTIPTNILQEDVVPAARKDPNYLNSRNMVAYDENNNPVDQSKIDWDNATQYTFEQQEGPNNPLGRVKLIYPNKYAVYLHDTPAKQRFDENVRAISHGCVRVQNALDLAEYVLQDQPGWNRQKIDEVIASGETTQVPVEQKILVHHLYYTAWREGGETHFTKDIYEYDDPVYEQLQ